ncbi:MAG: hypothetical protein QW680_07655 [Pyrobaculum sp.]
MKYEVKYISYRCQPPPGPLPYPREKRDGWTVYYLPCGTLTVTQSAALLKGRCDPREFNLQDCRVYQRIVVVEVQQVRTDCVKGDTMEGRALQIILQCGKKRIALFYPSTKRITIFTGDSTVEECLQRLEACLT